MKICGALTVTDFELSGLRLEKAPQFLWASPDGKLLEFPDNDIDIVFFRRNSCKWVICIDYVAIFLEFAMTVSVVFVRTDLELIQYWKLLFFSVIVDYSHNFSDCGCYGDKLCALIVSSKPRLG